MVFTVISCRNSCSILDKETWEKKLTEYNLTDLVLACNASHPQYPDPTQEHLIQKIQDTGYDYHLKKSFEWGCHITNPSRFFLTHVYCDKLKNL